ncbi:hypothetical protein [Mariniflexile fucanivorans]|uniref:hypothetical protein n=1 Tax=Mariniflexile fucanivorans TaxID=264023 RepID=UPI00105266CA|nr:hypothetical protein [Mariniflexile fucanivorans]
MNSAPQGTALFSGCKPTMLFFIPQQFFDIFFDLFFEALFKPFKPIPQLVYEPSPSTTIAVLSGCKHSTLFPFRNGFSALFFAFFFLFVLWDGFQQVTY